MSRKLILREVWEFYDSPELFIAIDQLRNRFLCLLTERGEVDSYVCIQISRRRYFDLLRGEMDLRTALENPEIPEYFVVSYQGEIEFEAEPLGKSKIPEDWLPEPGYFATHVWEYFLERYQAAVKAVQKELISSCWGNSIVCAPGLGVKAITAITALWKKCLPSPETKATPSFSKNFLRLQSQQENSESRKGFQSKVERWVLSDSDETRASSETELALAA